MSGRHPIPLEPASAADAPPADARPRGRAVLITGLDRSGKTELRRLLATQPWIVLHRDGTWERLVRDGAQVPAIARHLERRGQKARASGHAHWGEQGAEIELIVDALVAIDPGVLILHLVRDPRDRFALSDRSRRWGGVGPATEAWLASVASAEHNAARHPAQVQVVRHEDVVQDPMATLERITRVLGETVAPCVDLPDLGAGSVGVHATTLGAAARRFIEDRAGPMMERHGYRIGGLSLPLSTRLRLRMGTEPAAALRLGGRRMVHRDATTRRARAGKEAIR